MNDVTKAVSLEQIVWKFMIFYFYKHFSNYLIFVTIFVTLLLFLILERSHPIPWFSKFNMCTNFMLQLMFCLLDNIRFHKIFVLGVFFVFTFLFF